jgi:hypothetical protein
MNKTKWSTIGLVLILALVLLWAVPGLAQMRGRGQWGQAGQGNQGWGCAQGQGYGQGYGPGYGNCPYNQGYQNRQNWGNYPQANMGRRGPRGGGRNYQPNTQPAAPPVTP